MKHCGVYISDDSIRLPQEPFSGQRLDQTTSESVPLDSPDPATAIREWVRKYKHASDSLTVGIPRSMVSFRYLTFPTMDEREIRQMVDYEIANLFPFKPDELICDYAVVRKNALGYSKLIVVAVQKELLARHIALLGTAGLSPDRISVSTISIFNTFIASYPEQKKYLLVFFDGASLEILAMDARELIFSRGIPLREGFSPAAVAREVRLTLIVLAEQGYTPEIAVIAGNGLDLAGIADTLKPLIHCDMVVETSLDVLAGLQGQPDARAPLTINLMPAELRHAHTRNVRKWSMIYAGGLILINCALLTSIMVLKVKYRQTYLEGLVSDIKRINESTVEVKKKISAVQILRTYRNAGKTALAVLSEVYRFAPSNISISALDINNQFDTGTLVLAGNGPDSATVLGFANSLKTSALIKTADVISLKKKTTPTDKYRVDFELKANY